jgi:hypothetical protein
MKELDYINQMKVLVLLQKTIYVYIKHLIIKCVLMILIQKQYKKNFI